MSVIVTQNPVLIGDEFNLTLDHPIIGWQSVVTASTIAASSSATNFPVSNLANPATHLFWKSAANGATITIGTGGNEIDYVAIAKHNLGSTATPVTVGYYDTSSPPVFTTVTAETILADDAPALFRFDVQVGKPITIILGTGTGAPQQIAVVYCGKLLVLPRKVYQGYAPIPYALIAKVTNGRSEAGNFLGRIVLQEFVKDTMPLSLISPTYFRDHIAEFLIDSKERPFFIAWRPEMYPDEIGYCHMTNDPLPTNEAPHGLIAMQLEMTGII